MEHTLFYNSFQFRVITVHNFLHNDNSEGIPCHYLARMRRGRGRIRTLDGFVLELSPGDVFYLPCGLRYHSYWTPDDAPAPCVEWESYGFAFLPEADSFQYKMQLLSPTEECTHLFDRLCTLDGSCSEAIGLLYRLMGIFLPAMESFEREKQEILLQKARAYLKHHPDCKMTELARACCISESGLYTLFRNCAGTTPIREKNRMLVEQAIALLMDTDYSVEQISAQLHFSSAAYFRKIFKEQTGKTPTQLRRELAFQHTI